MFLIIRIDSLKNIFLLFFLYLIAPKAISQDSLSFMEIGIGYTFEPNSKSAINFSLEKKIKKIDLFSFQVDFSVFKLTGGASKKYNGTTVLAASFPVTRQHVSASVKWYPMTFLPNLDSQ